MAAARGFKKALRWFPRSSAVSREEGEDSNERNGLLRSHLEHNQIVPVTDLDEQPKALAAHVEPKTLLRIYSCDFRNIFRSYASLKFWHDIVFLALAQTLALKVSMHCYGCARKVEKQISTLEGVVSVKVELEIKKVAVFGNPMEVLQSVSKVMKYPQILAPVPS